MSDILLAKPKLGPEWIDCAVGESHLIREAVLSTYNIDMAELDSSLSWEYPSPEGDKELTDILSKRYNAPVVMTNGAKQGLGACFYALQKLGCSSVGMRSPYWALIPPLVKFHGLTPVPSYDADSCLAVLPGNPDGYMMSPEEIENFVEDCNEKDKYLIHDAVYHTHSYLPESFELSSFGDVQLYSASKMWGLSGIRIGWAVCHNYKFYNLIKEYVEMMTVGVSEISQQFLLQNIIRQEEEKPSIKKKFEKRSFLALKEARNLFKEVNQDVLELPSDFENTAGMFIWAKLKNAEALKSAKIYVIEGTPFGKPGYVRLNLAITKANLKEVIARLD